MWATLTTRSHLKKVFSPEPGVVPSPQVFYTLTVACRLIPDRASISTENPNFEIAYGMPDSERVVS